ncbi:hypothetical protein SDRG_04661 [Saprolegnia diclina VS20]|uniref:START domain-containing protein n=1 Tax=Saprolegnia diclina (strain VS20) TaxID=1156394 RepID=T0QJL5_SAPDV|nr:hypothetical protein SDRG_04661 [Saprolegnia diclina VS20]EQC38234.1 hypothetical protein SDRG_04661 [Saprolegnia diclina VS20]|eukprot:XP_008608561.1 hypothetical protein SDRG_04661 [Saprolegnia diclina VS20]
MMKFVQRPHPPMLASLKPSDLDVHPSWLPSLAHIKSKRVKELECLRRQVYILQGHIEKLKRCHSTQLSWEDVAQALKDDTLDQVRDNRSLKKKLAHNKRLGVFLKTWMEATPPPALQHIETWRHSQLVCGDDASRALGYEWIARQSYYNTTAVMAHIAFPVHETDDDFVRVAVDIDDDARFFVQVAAQQVVPYDLAAVHNAFWVAEKTFAAAFRDRCTQLTDLSAPTNDILYVRENLGTPTQRIFNKSLQARFQSPASVTFVLRSILRDDMFPDDDADDTDPWSFNTKFWMVADALPNGSTRCRTFYTLEHPCTHSGGYVSLDQLARCVGLGGSTEATLLAVLKERFLNSHHAQRLFFAEHFSTVLGAMATRMDDDDAVVQV